MFFFITILFIVMHRETKWKKAFEEYINTPNEQNEETLIELISDSDKSIIRVIVQSFKEKKYVNNQLLTQISDYEEYVESWAHEIKTSISLLTILLDNHSDKIPCLVSAKIDYARKRMQEYVEQILFYARLKGEKKDYFFENIFLEELLDDILEDYEPLLEEKKFIVRKELSETFVFSDKRGLKFLLGQVISNSIKYTKVDIIPEIELPYVFEKGFTGDSGEHRKKATGMGLYLVKEIAAQLNLEIGIESERMNGAEIKI